MWSITRDKLRNPKRIKSQRKHTNYKLYREQTDEFNLKMYKRKENLYVWWESEVGNYCVFPEIILLYTRPGLVG